MAYMAFLKCQSGVAFDKSRNGLTNQEQVAENRHSWTRAILAWFDGAIFLSHDRVSS